MWICEVSKLKKSEILLSSDFFKDETVLPRKALLHIGNWKNEVSISYDHSLQLQTDELGLSKNLLNEFTLPLDRPYILKWDGRSLRLGPVIAFVALSKTEILAEKLDIFADYFVNHPNFHGLIYICAADGINKERKIVQGFYYLGFQREESDKSLKWQKGTFPYPGAIYRKTGFSAQLYQEVFSDICPNIFNTYFFNKWELWDWLSSNERCRSYLPHTRKLQDFEDIKEMIDLHREVYLKKINSHKAKGIIKVSRINGEYVFQYRFKERVSFDNAEKINNFIKKINPRKDYLVQQAIPIRVHEDRNFDFRVIMQKDRTGNWICNGNIARFGKKHSIATNFLLAGYALAGNEALQAVFGYNQQEAFKKVEEIIAACVHVCTQLDQCGGIYGDLGVDVIVDENEKVWILEVNKLHDHKYPLYALDDMQMYYRVVTTPFEYATYLAGF